MGRLTMISQVAFLIAIGQCVGGTVIQNSLLGVPTISCGPEVINVLGHTEEPFEGVVYIRDWRKQEGCYRSYINSSREQTPNLDIDLTKLSQCGMAMKRTPETGEVEIRGVWVFSFHPRFVTKVDKAYDVHCIFRQKEVTVTNGLSVNMLSTRDTLVATASMPSVEMKIIAGNIPNIAREAVTEVQVGDPLTFIWWTPAPSDMYGIIVKDCFVQHKAGSNIKIIDQGCTVDDVAVSDLTYAETMHEAHASAMAFKFADYQDLWFKCTVAVCMKENSTTTRNPNTVDGCNLMKPTCTRRKREVGSFEKYAALPLIEADHTYTEQKISVVDYYNQRAIDKATIKDQQDKKIILYHQPVRQNLTTVNRRSPKPRWTFCMRKPIFALVTSVVAVLYLTTFVMATVALLLYIKRKQGESSIWDLLSRVTA